MAKQCEWNGFKYPSISKAAHIHGYSPDELSYFLKQGYTSDDDVEAARPKGNPIKRVCIVTENRSEEVDDILSAMYYELVELHGWGLQILIPDVQNNQSVFDIFNEPEGGFCVNCLIAHHHNQYIQGQPNIRSAFVDLSEPYGYTPKTWSGMVETVGRGKNAEYYPIGRTDTTKDRFGLVRMCIERCDTFVGLWQTGNMLKGAAQIANSLGREVVLVDIK
jgi:hypothetical protein